MSYMLVGSEYLKTRRLKKSHLGDSTCTSCCLPSMNLLNKVRAVNQSLVQSIVLTFRRRKLSM